MAGGGAKRKRVFKKISSSANLIFGLRAGEEVSASRALMVGDFWRELSGEDARDSVIVVLEASVDSATTQVEFDGFVGREIKNLDAWAGLREVLGGYGVEERVNVVVGRFGGRPASARLAEEERHAVRFLYQFHIIRCEADERARAFDQPRLLEKPSARACVVAHGAPHHQRGLLAVERLINVPDGAFRPP